MKTTNTYLAGILLLLIISSCSKEHFGIIKGKGPLVTEARTIYDFNKIEHCMNAELYYVQDSVFKVEVSAQQNLMEYIKTEISGTVLKIYEIKTILKHEPIKFIIHSPELYKLTLDGSGKIYAGGIISSSLEIVTSGSGDIEVSSLNTQNAEVKISGSGKITVNTGNSASLTANISGSGDIELLNLNSVTATVSVSGSGNISTQVSQQLNVNISGSGNVKYRGNPSVNATVSGSGKLIHLN